MNMFLAIYLAIYGIFSLLNVLAVGLVCAAGKKMQLPKPPNPAGGLLGILFGFPLVLPMLWAAYLFWIAR